MGNSLSSGESSDLDACNILHKVVNPVRIATLCDIPANSFSAELHDGLLKVSFLINTTVAGKLTIHKCVNYDYPHTLSPLESTKLRVPSGLSLPYSALISFEADQLETKYNYCPIVIQLACQDQVATCYLSIKDTAPLSVVQKNLKISGEVYELVDLFSTDNKQCVVCLDNQLEIMLAPCKHFCMCWKCAELLMSKSQTCPICRVYIEEYYCIGN